MSSLRDGVRTAFAPLLTAETSPTPDAILLLGRALYLARLDEFIEPSIDGPGIGPGIARGMLSAATHGPKGRILKSRDGIAPDVSELESRDSHVRMLLQRMAHQPRLWLHVRDELVKFSKLVDAEIEARTLIADSPEASEAKGDGRYVERDREVVRLKREKPGRSAAQIANLIISAYPDWATMDNGKPFSGAAVRSILRRSRASRRNSS